ncbi:hypothetical protein [Mycobacterium sp.]|uniref:hypothetical protein n=1 Tax=Mycobacterium sp. TaxID=1785 RepID=UPI003D6C1F79
MSARSAVRRFGTPAHLASQPGAPMRPPRRYTQSELRQRRRAGLTVVHYSGDWSLAREIAEVVGPLAEQVAASSRPARFKLPVMWMAEAVHELVGTAVGWVAEVDARRRTEHLAGEPGKRAYAVKTLMDLAQRPALPEVTDKALANTRWAGRLVALADGADADAGRRPVSDSLADMLAHAYPPGAPALRGQTSRSERLAQLLSRTLDRGVLELARRLDAAEGQPEPTETTPADPRAELARLGITTD